MIALRWLLGGTIAALGGGYLFLFFVSNGFRRSFGASENNPLLAILPLGAVAILFAAVVFPQKMLLHAGAVTALALVGYCIWAMLEESATVMWFALLYLGAWLCFYWNSALRTVS